MFSQLNISISTHPTDLVERHPKQSLTALAYQS